MARKAEEGILYFPMNTDLIHNPKIKLVVVEFGPKAWAVLLPLYCKIYREKGYWIDWLNEDIKLLFANDECRCEVHFLNEVVAGCVRRGLFDKTVFDMFGVLTSDRIQENYLEAKKRNKEVPLISEFLLISDNVHKNANNVNIISLNVNIITKNVDISTQSKKEKKIIEGEVNTFTHPILKSNLFREPNVPTINKVVEKFTTSGGTKEMAEKFYESNEAVGWFYKGSPITNFSNLVPGYITSWQKNNNKTPGNYDGMTSEQANELKMVR